MVKSKLRVTQVLHQKRSKATSKPKVSSSYQATKAKAHKARGHKGSNTRQRRTATSQTGRRGKRR